MSLHKALNLANRRGELCVRTKWYDTKRYFKVIALYKQPNDKATNINTDKSVCYSAVQILIALNLWPHLNLCGWCLGLFASGDGDSTAEGALG